MLFYTLNGVFIGNILFLQFLTPQGKTPILYQTYDVQHSATHFSHRLVFKVAVALPLCRIFRGGGLLVYELVKYSLRLADRKVKGRKTNHRKEIVLQLYASDYYTEENV